jgi:hypothetical protein
VILNHQLRRRPKTSLAISRLFTHAPKLDIPPLPCQVIFFHSRSVATRIVCYENPIENGTTSLIGLPLLSLVGSSHH